MYFVNVKNGIIVDARRTCDEARINALTPDSLSVPFES